MNNQAVSDSGSVARDYYDSSDADRFYFLIWGGEDIHVGIYERDDEDIFDASRRTVSLMADQIIPVPESSRVLDMGSGYGGAARSLVDQFRCHVTCLNVSAVQNRRTREMNEAGGLSHHIDVVEGRFEDLPFDSQSFDVVWSQDAILHSGDRRRVLEEVDRVLKPGGRFVFTDPMKSDECPNENLKPVLDRIHLSTLGSPGYYRQVAGDLGWKEVQWDDRSSQLSNHYRRVHEEMESREDELAKVCSFEYIERMKTGLQHWVRHGGQGDLKWGVFLFQKPG